MARKPKKQQMIYRGKPVHPSMEGIVEDFSLKLRSQAKALVDLQTQVTGEVNQWRELVNRVEDRLQESVRKANELTLASCANAIAAFRQSSASQISHEALRLEHESLAESIHEHHLDDLWQRSRDLEKQCDVLRVRLNTVQGGVPGPSEPPTGVKPFYDHQGDARCGQSVYNCGVCGMPSHYMCTKVTGKMLEVEEQLYACRTCLVVAVNRLSCGSTRDVTVRQAKAQ